MEVRQQILKQRSNERFRMFLSRIDELAAVVIVVTIVLALFILVSVHDTELPEDEHKDMKNNATVIYAIDTSGCRIPKVPTHMKSCAKKLCSPHKITCEYAGNTVPLVESNYSRIWVNVAALNLYNVSIGTKMFCCYEEFYRPVTSLVNGHQETYRYSGECVKFWDPIMISAEFVKASCSINDHVVYTDFFAFVPRKLEIEDRKFRQFNQSGTVNVMILGINAVSRGNFKHAMNRTYKFLMKNLSAIDMIGFNVVSNNTFGNMMPLLTGRTVDEIRRSCWQKVKSNFDKCKFIWKDFMNAGFRTILAEDELNSELFHFKGYSSFSNAPTDYYFNTLRYVVENESNKNISTPTCLGPRLNFDILIQYAETVAYLMKLVPYFGLFWESSITKLKAANAFLCDEAYFTLLENLHQDHILNNTILIVVSDSGFPAYHKRPVHPSLLEDSQPFLYIVLPTWFNKTHKTAVANIRTNAQRLITPFDLYHTLKDLSNFSTNLRDDDILSRALDLKQLTNTRGISLFLPIPPERTCELAGIRLELCPCYESVPQDVTDKSVLEAAQNIVTYMNNLTDNYPLCIPLTLSKVKSATISQPNSHYSTLLVPLKDYTLIIETIPGESILQATIRKANQTWEIVGNITHLNFNLKNSACMAMNSLRPYCYCNTTKL